MKRRRIFYIFALMSAISTFSWAEKPASATLQQPLASTPPICFTFSSTKEAFSALQRHLTGNGFTVGSNSGRQGELLAIKSEGKGVEGRYLAWLSRDLEDCKKITVSVKYGKFEEQFGKGWTRVVVSETEEDRSVDAFVRVLNSNPFSCPPQLLEPTPMPEQTTGVPPK